VSGAIVGAGAASASLALVAGEALTVPSLTVANATVRALRILVTVHVPVGRVNPSKLKRADALRAIAGEMLQTKSPVVVAFADAAFAACSVTCRWKGSGSV